MAEPRAVVITGASRGLGFASAVRLYREGWRVVAAMRNPDSGLPLLRGAAGARSDDDRLIGVRLDLLDSASVCAAAKAVEDAVGAPYAVVHNAGISAAGMVEETDTVVWQNMFATSVLGPVELTKALLPAMRAAGEGRIVLVSSAAGVRGQPATAPYSAAKGAVERWGESMACEIAPFGLGVGVVQGRFAKRVDLAAQVGVDVFAFEVGQLAFGEARRRTANEDTRHGHSLGPVRARQPVGAGGGRAGRRE